MPPNTAVCRLCLSIDVPITKISGTPLQLVFENLTKIALHNEGRPVAACYICYAQLAKCYKLMLKAYETETVLADLLLKYTKITVNAVSGINYKASSVCQLTTSTPEVIDNIAAARKESPEVAEKTEHKTEQLEVTSEPVEVIISDDDEQCNSSDEVKNIKAQDIQDGPPLPAAADFDGDHKIDEESIPLSDVVMNCTDEEDRNSIISDIEEYGASQNSQDEELNEPAEETTKNETTQNQHLQKPHCSFCYKTYSSLKGLSKHLKIHLSEKTYECDICHKMFFRYDSMRRHKKLNCNAGSVKKRKLNTLYE